MSQAHGITRLEGVSANRPTANARGDRGSDAGPVREGTGPGIHRGVCDRVLAARFHEMVTLQEHPEQRGGLCC